MLPRKCIGLILILTTSALFACGGGGGGADPNAPASITVTASKTLALADGSDAVTMQAEVKKADGTAVPDGTQVGFSAPAGAILSAASAATANGIASVTLSRAPVSGANNETVTVTAASGGASGNKGVKFINQPASADVLISLNPAVTNLGSLDFKLNNTQGATFDITAQPVVAVNSALGSLVLGNFNAASNRTTFNLINAAGFDTGTAPIIKATFAVNAGLPAFSVDATPASISATDALSAAITPALAAENVVVTVTFDTEL